ncbi:MAG TPA: acetyl-CoA carboxylase biotin carboxylase subunit [Sandaracinaceae bacterium LLY-WYZ-13_1]|nr:acetyl-CoA carboxylase biotin carboxylase subunit [Sandaracinaceae bacterium LLY-WYZ-13_1]
MTIRPIRKLLIANRGEIAARIARTCRRLGVETVAVFSDADADAPFVRLADEAVRIGPAPSAESYLKMDRIVAAAKRCGADAIHPGFGFLAENAGFARAVKEAGLVFVGPSPEAIESMGSKQRAKQIAKDADVPTIPGYDGEDQDPEVLREKALEIGLPVLVKASAGGGGKGMRVVRDDGELDAAIESAKREAKSSFGDDTLLVEKYVERPRHVEIQILGDEHGNLVHLWERECSIQRRHQKIVEEAPSPALDRELRQAMGKAAVKLGRAIGYANAGTVEMILDPDGRFYFLEVNTRLQVEHPVTEAITDVDLVELQLRVARGEELPLDQEMVDTIVSGWAMEVRIYAEDPGQDFLPQSGPVLDWHLPEADWLRVDAGVETGSEVSIHYDPMLAKVITWGATRIDAIERMRWALRRSSIQGLRTNRDFLITLLEHEAFVAGDLHTHFIDEHLADVLGQAPDPGLVRDAAWAATLVAQAGRQASRRVLPAMRSGFRNNRYVDQEVRYAVGERALAVRYADLGGGAFRVTTVEGDGDPMVTHLRGVRVDGPEVVFEDDGGHRRGARVIAAGLRHHVRVDGRTVVLEEQPRFPDRSAESAADGAFAPMPGSVVKLVVSEGDRVTTGQTLAVMEAMKMEHSIGAPHDGVVTEIQVKEGQQVSEGAVLVVVKHEDDVEAAEDA